MVLCRICLKGIQDGDYTCEECDSPFHKICMPVNGNRTVHCPQCRDNLANSSISTANLDITPPSKASDDQYKVFNTESLKFLHLNARSLVAQNMEKFEELRKLVTKTNADVIGLSETRLDDKIADDHVLIPGYHIFRKDRNRRGGGVCVYIKNFENLEPAQRRIDGAQLREDMGNDELEVIWVEFNYQNKGQNRSILTGVGYRKNSQSDFFHDLQNSIYNGNSFAEHQCILLGNFNTDVGLLGSPLGDAAKKFQETFSLKQIISQPTRVATTRTTTNITESILDLIFVSNNIESNCHSGVIEIGIADHFLIYCILNA